MTANGIKPAKLARISDVSRQHLTRVRFGRMEPTRPVMVLVHLACCIILNRYVLITELFDFDDWNVVLARRRKRR